MQRPVKGLVVHQVAGHSRASCATGAGRAAEVDGEWRLGACQAHSGTHVMHAALRQVLGPTALQAGSYNRPGYLRLDFAWPGGAHAEQRAPTSRSVANQASAPTSTCPRPTCRWPRRAEIGALALFGETYGERGPGRRDRRRAGRASSAAAPTSQHSSQIGLLALTGESSVGSGVRRVEAFVGLEALPLPGQERALVRGAGRRCSRCSRTS